MIDMSYEIVDLISNEKDEEYVKDCLFFLYHTTNNKRLKSLIIDWFEDNDYCVDCGRKLETVSYQEYREGFGGCYETIYEKICEKCG